jgi:hypothetical protein
MKFITSLVQRIRSSMRLNKPMGRWQNEECDIKIAKKIDWSNEDHCGPCGSQDIKQQNKKIAELLEKLKDP